MFALVFFLVMAITSFASVGFDLEGEGDTYLPYYVVFGLAYGAAVRWWWWSVLPFQCFTSPSCARGGTS